ncbi:MAG TPA: translocation/assembly module TamB domain-containing protein, partial [Nevskiaceae bacterium]|nr:translocation/assembly module TamB domain-containing protein [Nevskiaceae bacterium]
TANVNLVLGSKVHFEGFGLKTDLTGSVRAIEQPGRPGSGRGEVRLEGGRYKAYGQELEIEQGRLLFNGGPLTEPGLEIRAVRKPTDEIEIGVLVRGTLAKPLFQITSVPPMPRERQLSWLVLGRDLESTGSGDERAMLANAALSLGLTGTDFIAQNLRGRLGLDEISIGADAGDEADQARFTIGKYLSPKLYVSYGVGIFQPGNVFKLLYDLGHGFKLSTESGVVTGGDLLYTVETGKPDKAETASPGAGR